MPESLGEQSILVPEIVKPGSVYWREYMSMVRSPKSIGGVVGLALGNAPTANLL
ncbi:MULTISPECIES: hypothetical protein [unclassified Microcystis]|uniref:hypothetical protein n=1 Tax=unclassified Microcystis TaxID=2643300 RepID=UPI00258A04FB|nr:MULTISPECIES: hypothetical protein [unclassified Microcystis]MCA2877791.1 hypothetical protein [Microcystis sp. M051S1]